VEMKIKCNVCKRKIDEEGMLWVVWEDRNICRKCYDRLWKEGIGMVVMPHTATID